jgi:hypothetical protein
MGYADRFVRERVGDLTLERVQNNLQRFFKLISEAVESLENRATVLEDTFTTFPLENGEPVQNQVLAIGANTINHTLGRVPAGYIVTRTQTAVPGIYDTAMDATTITLQSDAIATIDLWVF